MTHETDSNSEWTPLNHNTGGWGSLLPVSRRRIGIWALVLDSQGIPCRIMRYGIGWHLLVQPERLENARQQLGRYESENTGWPPPPPKPNPLAENTLATVSVLVLLATFHNVTQLNTPLFGFPSPEWLQTGSAHAGRILNGDWWRLVTALTLHSNVTHLLSNLTIGGFFIISLCRELGSGLAWSLLLAAGILGNLANAHFHLPTHNSVGSSTLIFGGVGILSAISMIRYRNHLRKRWYAPAGGALALLASLGTEGVNTDLGAHFFGFFFGFIIGLLTEYVIEKKGRPVKTVNAILSLLSAATIVTAWWWGISSG